MEEAVQVGRYQVQKVLGQGAMGVVYLAYDPQIGRRVALKTVRPVEGARPDEVEAIRARFLREAQAAGKLLHPNIVTIFDVFEDRGTLYIAMEYVEGVLLDTFCTRKNLLPVEQVLHLVDQGLAALDYAHRNGIVHRDIKPGNLMVVGGQTLKVMDFGLARQSDAHLTHSGTVIGTPHYMSPEQIQGKMLDGRSDLFSMGVVLYELVTGERPFQGDNISTVVYRVVHYAPPPVRELNSRLPESLNLIIQKAMAKEPEKRFLSAHAFSEALRGFRDGDVEATWTEEARSVPSVHDAVLPPPPSTGVTRRKHHFSKKAVWGAVAAALLVVGGFAGWTYFREQIMGRAETSVVAPPSQEQLPRPVEVVTTPPGAWLYLDGQRVEAVTLAPGDATFHTVEARLGCLSAKTQIAGNQKRDRLQLALQPGPFEVPVESEPPGASIFVDDKDTGLKTPARLPRADCQPFNLTLRLDGYAAFNDAFDPTKTNDVKASLAKEAPPGSLRVVGASGILHVYEGTRLLGSSGQVLSLPAGEYTLRLVDPALRGTREQQVTVKAGATQTVKVPAFETGTVFLYAKPANDGKVMVDGAYLEELPLNGTTPLAVGRHQFQVVGPSGRRVSFSWVIKAGDQTRIVDFDTGKVESP